MFSSLPIMETSLDAQGERTYGYSQPQTPRTLQHSKKRKSSRIGNVIRKLLGRKTIKSQISLPTPAQPLDEGHPRLIHAPNGPRAVSLPVRNVSRGSALGSHPFGDDPCVEEKIPGMNGYQLRQPPRLRRASMPSAVNPVEHVLEATVPESREYIQGGVDVDNIGYAVTSGSHPKRRSKSAAALYDLAKEALSADQVRRRSDEIRFWRNSLAIGPSCYSAEAEVSMHREFPLRQEQSAFSESQSATSLVIEDELPVEREDREKYQSYDFNAIATKLNEQEHIPLEERLMIVEIKLMDLENAIAKARSPSPPSATTATPRPGANTVPTIAIPQTPDKIPQRSPSHSKSEPRTDSTVSDVPSTQPTTSSLSLRPSPLPIQEPFAKPGKERPISTETAVHQPQGASVESPNSSRSSKPRPISLTSITIDHYTTLISLIRREQHARIRLENQVAELQREVFRLLHPQPAGLSSSPHSAVSNSGGSLYRSRRWDGSRKDVVKIDDFHMSKRRKSYEGPEDDDGAGTLISTDDGYPDVFATPTESNRMEIEAKPWGRREGEAF